MRNLRFCIGFAALSLLVVALVTGCSNPLEDVRVTLCKDIVSTQVGPGATLKGVDTETKGYEYAAVRVWFNSEGREAQALCYYDHNAVDNTADLLSDPLAAYATSPFKVVIGGQELSKTGLAEAVMQAMSKQGKDAAAKIEELKVTGERRGN